MGVRYGLARAVSAVSTWGLKNVFRRPAANFPGKFALYADPQVIEHAMTRVTEGSICVVGTNGKTSTTLLLADALEQAGKTVVCNRTGANLDSGVATALLHSGEAQWGVFESDELWLARTLPQTKSTYVLLLNLFRDQLDRVGEIDRIQESIVRALESSPETVLIYNADDPLCQAIANAAGNVSLGFGVAEDLGLPQNTVADAQMCQACSGMLDYAWRQYGQLGSYRCTECDFERGSLGFAARNVELGAKLSFDVTRDASALPAQLPACALAPDTPLHLDSKQSSPYMVYNLLAAAAAATLMGVEAAALQRAIDAFNPENGRLQAYRLRNRNVLLNLAKNPTGFNQNLAIIRQDPALKVVAFLVNDKEADGHDISWIWDVDFEELAKAGNCIAYVGGLRKNDLQVRLKYAGLEAALIDSMEDLFKQATAVPDLPAEANFYVITNYTALPSAHDQLDAMRAAEDAAAKQADKYFTVPARKAEGADAGDAADGKAEASAGETAGCASVSSATDESMANSDCPPVVIAHMFPDLLNLYGDGGNVLILKRRLEWRGIPVEVRRVEHGESIDFSTVDLVFLGGGPDREQRLAADQLGAMKDALSTYVESDGTVLAICGGYQVLGTTWLLGDEEVDGLGIIAMKTQAVAQAAANTRLIDNIVLSSPLATRPVVGYENHAGRTYLSAGTEPLGTVVSSVGHGNNDSDKADGARYRNVVGTYLHGPFLSKNPEVADWLLARALEGYSRRTGAVAPTLEALDDAVEAAANAFMVGKLGVH